MTYAEASQIVQDHTGLDLLESLELLTDDEDAFDLAPPRVQAAYQIMMVGFRQMFHGGNA